MNFTVLMENTKKDPQLHEEHGLSILVKHNKKEYLVDVGYSDGYIKNAQYLNESLDKVNDIIITHGHLDHGGGLAYIDQLPNRPIVHLKASALNTYYSKRVEGLTDIGLSQFKDENIDFNYIQSPQEISEGVHLLSVTREDKPKPISNGLLLDSTKSSDIFSHEIFIVFEEGDDLYVLTGCAHKGFLNIIDETKRHFPNKRIKALIGGLHLVNKSTPAKDYQNYLAQISSHLKDYSNIKIYTGHCTGQVAIDYLIDKGFDVIPLFTGQKIIF